ncbi:hypothetical protein ACH5RR_002877 [Cinchona calisaya]|uniref:Uncharacterized protein n=1 Tax=Cinchona calisaya TaxID=153742 RepID=A0ABD3AT98_9GENT
MNKVKTKWVLSAYPSILNQDLIDSLEKAIFKFMWKINYLGIVFQFDSSIDQIFLAWGGLAGGLKPTPGYNAGGKDRPRAFVPKGALASKRKRSSVIPT